MRLFNRPAAQLLRLRNLHFLSDTRELSIYPHDTLPVPPAENRHANSTVIPALRSDLCHVIEWTAPKELESHRVDL